MKAPSNKEAPKLYLVGGAVRDFLLKDMNGEFTSPEDKKAYWDSVEKDWVVVGSTPTMMLEVGYRPVGKSFPVFLHPQTQEEYALARTERKTNKGYTGFECYAGQNVTLEEDLKRRDLTINAIAASKDILPNINANNIEDPYQGYQDLVDKVFRHVSEAFSEDPVRILRVARLASRFGDFNVDKATNQLMQKMVQEGEVDALVPERVWQEWSRSLQEKFPWRFFEILEQCDALQLLFPKVSATEKKQHILERAVADGSPDTILFAIELHDLDELCVQQLCERYRIPANFRELSLMVAQYFQMYRSEKLWREPESILQLLEKTDAFRRRERFMQFLTTCDYVQAQKRGSKTSDRLKIILDELMSIDNTQFMEKGFTGKEFAQALRTVRLEKIGLFA